MASFPIYGVRVNIEAIELEADAKRRGSGQLVPMFVKAMKQAFLSAMPTLMAPQNKVEIICPMDAIGGVYNTLNMRKAIIVSENTIPSNGFVRIVGMLSALDSTRFSTDLR